jgi:hypothetical protein
MKQGSSFAELFERVRSGDEQAATQLVQEFEPVVRRELRFRLRDNTFSSPPIKRWEVGAIQVTSPGLRAIRF